MSRCKPLLRAGNKSHQAKNYFKKMVLNSGSGMPDLPPKHGRWVWQNQQLEIEPGGAAAM